MPEPMPENTRQQTITKLQELRRTVATIQLMESRGALQKSAAERIQDQQIISEAQLLLKEAFALGPAGQRCPNCNISSVIRRRK